MSRASIASLQSPLQIKQHSIDRRQINALICARFPHPGNPGELFGGEEIVQEEDEEEEVEEDEEVEEEVSSRVSLLSYSVVGTLNDLDLGL